MGGRRSEGSANLTNLGKLKVTIRKTVGGEIGPDGHSAWRGPWRVRGPAEAGGRDLPQVTQQVGPSTGTSTQVPWLLPWKIPKCPVTAEGGL